MRARRTRLKRVARLLLALLVLQPFGMWLPTAWADSGGYSRPSSSGYSAPSYSRAPPYATSDYSRPPASSSQSYGFSSSGGDRAISRQSSGQALQSYRAANTPAPQNQAPTPPGFGNSWGQPGSYPSPPPAYTAGPRRFGAWDAVTLWALLEAVNTPRSSNFFAQNQNSPDYLQWRAEMNRLAPSDPQVAPKLAQLDKQLGKPASNIAAQATNTEAADEGITMLVLMLGVVLFAGLWYMRRRAKARLADQANPGRSAFTPASIGGSSKTRFRVGMTLPVDQTPFILASGMTKVAPPEEGNLVSIEAIGLIADGPAAALHRLYLPGRNSFFALHLDQLGAADECRYFSLIDQVTPATQEDWAFWLDPAEGMIGWPEFQTKDGTLYGRVWAGGTTRVPPRDQLETIRDLSGDRGRTLHAMLYGRPTGAPAPAPATEYILVEAVEQDGAAWVDIHAGIDINPAALTLPPVAFA
jgi:hypothetical protein